MREDDLVYLHGSHTPRCTAVVDKHFVGYGTIQMMSRGRLELQYGPRAQILEGRWFWPAVPGPRTRFRCAAGCPWWEHRYIAVRGPLLDRWRSEGLWPARPQPAPPDADLEALVDGVNELCRRGDRWSHRRGVNLLEQILLRLAEARQDAGDEEPWLRQAKRALAEPQVEALDCAAIARALGMADSTFRRRFRDAVHMAPREFAMEARLRAARERLLEGDEPVAEVAAALGYADAAFFCRQFRRHTGMSPSAYRRSRQA